MHLPILLRHEGVDFTLALHDQAYRHRLHSPRGKPPGYLGPQQRRHHVPHHPVEKATGLLRVDPVLVQVGRLLEGLGDGFFGDLVEHHALVAAVVAADGLPQVPGDGLPLAVKVGREVDRVGAGGELPEFAHHFLLARENLVIGLPAVRRVDAHAPDQLVPGLLLAVLGLFFRGHLAGLGRLGGALLGVHTSAAAGGRQVADMTHAGLDDKVRTQVLVDGFRLGWRFDDD